MECIRTKICELRRKKKIIVFLCTGVLKFHPSIFWNKLCVFHAEVSRSYVALLMLCAKGARIPQQSASQCTLGVHCAQCCLVMVRASTAKAHWHTDPSLLQQPD